MSFFNVSMVLLTSIFAIILSLNEGSITLMGINAYFRIKWSGVCRVVVVPDSLTDTIFITGYG